eukprot:8831197-Prorocentrum_lima.AAC.1
MAIGGISLVGQLDKRANSKAQIGAQVACVRGQTPTYRRPKQNGRCMTRQLGLQARGDWIPQE